MIDKFAETSAVADSAVSNLNWKVIEGGEAPEIAGLIHGMIWDCFVLGWEKSKEAHAITTQFLDNELYRKGVVAAFDGMEFTHGGSTYLNLKTSNGSTTEFNLRNLPNYTALESFSMLSVRLSGDEHIAALADQSTELSKALQLISGVVEKVYWRKVAASLQSYHTESMLRLKARSILETAGMSIDDIDHLIAEPTVDHD